MNGKRAWRAAVLVAVVGVAVAGAATIARADDDLLRRRLVLRPPQGPQPGAPAQAPGGGPVVPIDPPDTQPPPRVPGEQAPAAVGRQSDDRGGWDWWQRVLQTFALLR